MLIGKQNCIESFPGLVLNYVKRLNVRGFLKLSLWNEQEDVIYFDCIDGFGDGRVDHCPDKLVKAGC